MSRASPMPKKHPLHDFNRCLEADGWLSPDTYGNDFSSPEDLPAVYLFVAVDMDDLTRFHVAYVGMSMALKTRWQRHPTLRAIRKEGWHVRRLFKLEDPDNLRAVERHYIQKFNPPWNISGKARGMTA